MIKATLQVKKIALVVTMIGLSTSLQAAQVDGTATANVVAPISVSETTQMNFGDVSVGAGGGTVVLATDGSRTVTVDATAHTSGAGAAGAFSVTGNGNASYSLSISASATLANGANTMTADSFVHTAGVSPALTGGSDSFNVGGTLHMTGGQAQGTYTADGVTGTPYTVTVNYN